MKGAEWTAGDLRVGVVDDPRHSPARSSTDDSAAGRDDARPELDAVEELVTETGGTVVSGAAETVLDAAPSIVVTVGERALYSVARTATTIPVLPCSFGPGVRDVPPGRLEPALRSVLAGRATERARPLLSIEGDGGVERAAFDVTLVTAEPARISEYSIASRGESIDRFRADGLVVATPAGSHGYAGAAGGPLLADGVDSLVVVPIAPFVTGTDRWVLPAEALLISVERDEGDVELHADDRVLGTVSTGSPIEISAPESFSILVTDESRPLFE